jgi:hypothetical protein
MVVAAERWRICICPWAVVERLCAVVTEGWCWVTVEEDKNCAVVKKC